VKARGEGTPPVAVVLCTAPRQAAPGKLAAHDLARQLVAERLCACANVLDGVTSFFWWEGAVDRADEVLLVLKTTRAALPLLQRRIVELHPYAVPEVLAVDVAHGLPSYLQWLVAAVAAPGAAPGQSPAAGERSG